MRHPAAPAVIAILLGILGLVYLWNWWQGDAHHEGNPHPDDVPKKEVLKAHGERSEDEAAEGDLRKGISGHRDK